MKRHLCLAITLFAVTLLLSASAWAKPAVTGLRIGVHGDTTRVVLDLSAGLDYTVFTLPSPYRVVIDLPEVDWSPAGKNMPAVRGLVRRFRFGLFEPGTFRLVLDVSAPVTVRKKFMLRPTADFGYRLVLDLAAVSAAQFKRQGQPRQATAPSPQSATLAAPRPGGKPVIVIDAGHGGVDPGTTGVSGVFEKRITLAAARELKRQLQAGGRYRVVLTRSRDVFVRLPRRIEVARNAGASLFISLHADAIENRKVRGATVYTLSEKSSDAEAAQLAHKENKSDLIAGIDLSNDIYGNEVASILISLAQRETMNISARFANILIPELGKEGRLLRKTHRFAGFRVLKAPDVPSVLVELGYLSNRSDEKLLRNANYRRRLMRAVVRAVDRFFALKGTANRT